MILSDQMLQISIGNFSMGKMTNLDTLLVPQAIIAVFKIVGTAATLQLFWAVVAARLQTIVSHSFLHRFLRFFK